MATEIVLPQWGMEMQEGTVVKWFKDEGDTVETGEPLVEIETAKLTSELESSASGVVAHILVPVGETVPVRAALAIIADPGESVPRPETRAQAPASATSAPSSARSSASGAPAVQVTPVARRLATEHGVDLSTVQGTGPHGRITDGDVQRVIDGESTPSPAADATVAEVVPLKGMRGAIAERMLQSAQTAAAVTLTTEADVTELVSLQRDLVAAWRSRRLRPLELEFLVKAVGRELKRHSRLNAIVADQEIRVLEEVNVGVAISITDGLIVPVIRRADAKSLLDIAWEVRKAANKARKGDLTPEDTMGGTFTITSLSALDVDSFTPIINPPQVAILGVGRTVEKPSVYEGEIVARSMMHLSLTFDHRALDGAPAGEFLRGVKASLEDPAWMED